MYSGITRRGSLLSLYFGVAWYFVATHTLLQGYSTWFLRPLSLPSSSTQPFPGKPALTPPSLPGSSVQLLSPYSEVTQSLLLAATQLSPVLALIPSFLFLGALLQRYTPLGLPCLTQRLLSPYWHVLMLACSTLVTAVQAQRGLKALLSTYSEVTKTLVDQPCLTPTWQLVGLHSGAAFATQPLLR